MLVSPSRMNTSLRGWMSSRPAIDLKLDQHFFLHRALFALAAYEDVEWLPLGQHALEPNGLELDRMLARTSPFVAPARSIGIMHASDMLKPPCV